MRAIDVPVGRIFKDGDGDTHYRVLDGCVLFDKHGMYDIYATGELEDDAFGYFADCKVLKGELKIKRVK